MGRYLFVLPPELKKYKKPKILKSKQVTILPSRHSWNPEARAFYVGL